MNNQEAIGILESINAKTDYFLINDDARAEAINMAISALQAQDAPGTNVGDTVSRQAVIDAVRKCRVIEVTPAYILIDKGEAVSELAMLPSAQSKTVCVAKVTLSDEQIQEAVEKVKNEVVQVLPFAQPEWNNHTVACLLAELFDDTCACDYNGIDEWLPSKCDLLDSCPNPVGVACWEQFLKYRAERRTDE